MKMETDVIGLTIPENEQEVIESLLKLYEYANKIENSYDFVDFLYCIVHKVDECYGIRIKYKN